MGGGATDSTVFGVSMIAGSCGEMAVAADVGFADNGRTRMLGADAEEASAL